MSSKYTDQHMKGFLRRGKEVEKRFAKLLGNLVWATTGEDRRGHWDVSGNLPDEYCTNFIDKKQLKFDVKGLKKLNRFDSNYQDELAWIELRNVSGNRGWVLGDADYVVFERTNSWMVVLRQDLLELVDSKLKSLKYPVGKKPYHLYNQGAS